MPLSTTDFPSSSSSKPSIAEIAKFCCVRCSYQEPRTTIFAYSLENVFAESHALRIEKVRESQGHCSAEWLGSDLKTVDTLQDGIISYKAQLGELVQRYRANSGRKADVLQMPARASLRPSLLGYQERSIICSSLSICTSRTERAH